MNQGVSQIVPGCRVRVHLRLSFPDGEEAISTFNDAPLDFTLGDGTLTPGLEMALYGMRAGEKDRLELMPEQAYGPRNEALIHTLPRSDFNPELVLEPGSVIQFAAPNGEDTPGTVVSVSEDEVEVDFNHPLAGVPVILEIEVLDLGLPEKQYPSGN